ncbi:MAG: hypothetical protein JNL21_12540 [Myxococcales bacterium]|jgi:hypothetical protein|nr:hypothetical protein [Myxococcales bacterium]
MSDEDDSESGPSFENVLRPPILAYEHWISHVVLRVTGEPSIRQIMIALVAGRDRDRPPPRPLEKDPDPDRIGLRRRKGAPLPH